MSQKNKKRNWLPIEKWIPDSHSMVLQYNCNWSPPHSHLLRCTYTHRQQTHMHNYMHTLNRYTHKCVCVWFFFFFFFKFFLVVGGRVLDVYFPLKCILCFWKASLSIFQMYWYGLVSLNYILLMNFSG